MMSLVSLWVGTAVLMTGALVAAPVVYFVTKYGRDTRTFSGDPGDYILGALLTALLACILAVFGAAASAVGRHVLGAVLR